MITAIRKFKCGLCESGVVKLIEKETKRTSTLDVKRCDKCRESYGLKQLLNLTELPQQAMELGLSESRHKG